jgi:hypothetical protein
MRFVRRTVSRTAIACSTVCVIGFSQYTFLPASMASIEILPCQWSGVAIRTASMSFRSSSRR